MAALMNPVGSGGTHRRASQVGPKTRGGAQSTRYRTPLRVVGDSRPQEADALASGDGGALILSLPAGRRSDAGRVTANREPRRATAGRAQASITPLYGLVERIAPIRPLVLPVRPEDPDVAFERDVARRVAARRNARLERLRKRRMRALCAVVTSLGILSATWLGSSWLSGLHAKPYRVLPGSVKTATGYRYTVLSGDSIWSIATRLDPTGDPRPLADQIQAEVGSSALQPGTRILLP